MNASVAQAPQWKNCSPLKDAWNVIVDVYCKIIANSSFSVFVSSSMKLERTLFPLPFTTRSSLACSTSLGPAHVAGLNEAKRVVDAQRRQNANVPRVVISIYVRRRTFNGTAVPDTVMLIGFELKMLSYEDR